MPLSPSPSPPARPASALPADFASRPGAWALFLDIDGTLLDIAGGPDAVTVPPGLPAALSALHARLSGAVAFVTGRSVEVADRLFAPCRFAVAGLHGAELRLPDGSVSRAPVSDAFLSLKRELREAALGLPGVLFEDKGAAVALHYRAAPQSRPKVEELAARAAAGVPGWTLMPGKMVFEIRPRAADKGRALETLMAHGAFAGRRPLAIGDDVTDESMFEAANRLGGWSARVGTDARETAARGTLASPAALRKALAALAADAA